MIYMFRCCSLETSHPFGSCNMWQEGTVGMRASWEYLGNCVSHWLCWCPSPVWPWLHFFLHFVFGITFPCDFTASVASFQTGALLVCLRNDLPHLPYSFTDFYQKSKPIISTSCLHLQILLCIIALSCLHLQILLCIIAQVDSRG